MPESFSHYQIIGPLGAGGMGEVYRARDTELTLTVGRPLKLFTRLERDDRQPYGWPATFGVTPDGERFLTTEIVQDESLDPRIAIVEGWARSMGE
jgi:serine/threonine protein kinase